MNKSYKLLSIDFDRLPTYDKPISFKQYNKYIYDYDIQYNLFDLDYCIRKIKLSELLSLKDINDLYKIINLLNNCNELLIIIDYQNNNQIVNSYINKRISQIIKIISDNLININIYFSSIEKN